MSTLAFNIFDTYFSQHPTAKGVFTNPGRLISVLLPNIIVVFGIVFFAITVRNGFNYIVKAGITGKTAPEIAEYAKLKKSFSNSILGFLLAVAAYFILQILSVVTGINFQNSP